MAIDGCVPLVPLILYAWKLNDIIVTAHHKNRTSERQ